MSGFVRRTAALVVAVLLAHPCGFSAAQQGSDRQSPIEKDAISVVEPIEEGAPSEPGSQPWASEELRPMLPAAAESKPVGSVALFNPASRIRIAAGLDVLTEFSTARAFPSGIPLFLLPASPFGLDTNSFDVNARQSYLNANYSGPKVGDFEAGAQMLVFLQNHNLSADDYGLLVYYAFADLKNQDWRFAAGLQQDVFNPVSPTIIYLTKMYASGNTGSYRGQLRAERYFQDQDTAGLTVQAALSDPISTLVTSDSRRITEDNGWPNVEGRMEIGFGERRTIQGAPTRPLEIGISGVVGQFRTTRTLFADPSALPPRAVIDTWGLGADAEWFMTDRFGARGEYTIGQALGEYNGGILQSFNPETFQEVRTQGGFGEIFFFATPAFHVHVGYGADNPRASDLAPTQIRRNQTYFVNFVWDVTRSVQLGLELDYRKTDFFQFAPNAFLDNEGFILGNRFLMKF